MPLNPLVIELCKKNAGNWGIVQTKITQPVNRKILECDKSKTKRTFTRTNLFSYIKITIREDLERTHSQHLNTSNLCDRKSRLGNMR